MHSQSTHIRWNRLICSSSTCLKRFIKIYIFIQVLYTLINEIHKLFCYKTYIFINKHLYTARILLWIINTITHLLIFIFKKLYYFSYGLVFAIINLIPRAKKDRTNSSNHSKQNQKCKSFYNIIMHNLQIITENKPRNIIQS